MKKYDFVMGLGRACACSQSLRLAGLQLLSQPWDWITYEFTPPGPDLLLRVDVIASGFAGWLEEEDIKFVRKNPASGKDLYKNERNKIIYAHDFPPDVPMHESYPAIRAKYDRRVQRLQRLLAEAKSDILVVYMDAPTYPVADVETCRETQRRLQALYPHVKVDFLMFSLERGRPFEERIVEDLGNGFTRVAFDFKDYASGKPDHAVRLGECAAVLKSLASVREYRTRREIKAKNKVTREAKMREACVNNEWEYFLYRRRREFDRIREFLFPRILMAKLRRKKFDHVLSLGMNCEPAFRFSLSWGFVDSTPFAWASCGKPANLADALRHPEHIGCEGFSWHAKSAMWVCNRTGIAFHGKLMANSQPADLSPKVLEKDKAELVQRLAYLNEKLTRILSDDSSKALIYRVHTKVAKEEGASEMIDDVQSALEDRGARNYKLIVVTERSARRRIAPAPNRIVRSVYAFNPGSSVVKPKLGDPAGWKALFTEFSPSKILPKKHPFKFEME